MIDRMRPAASRRWLRPFWSRAGAGLVFMAVLSASAHAGTVTAEGWEPAARVGVAFTSSLLPTDQTLKGVATALDLYRQSTCYWVAAAVAPTPGSAAPAQAAAYALQSALLERDVAPKQVITLTQIDSRAAHATAELSIHCAPPTRLSFSFARASSALTDEIESWLDIVQASVPTGDKPLLIRAYAAPNEWPDPLKLALARAFALHRALVGERGYAGRVIQVEADIRKPDPSDHSPVNAEIIFH